MLCEAEYGPIKKHITALTSITQAMVDGQKHYADCFHDFIHWIGDEETRIYSWSMSDIKQLRNECRFKLPDFDVSWLNERWVDCSRSSMNAWGFTTAWLSSMRSVRWTINSRVRSIRRWPPSTRVPSSADAG